MRHVALVLSMALAATAAFGIGDGHQAGPDESRAQASDDLERSTEPTPQGKSGATPFACRVRPVFAEYVGLKAPEDLHLFLLSIEHFHHGAWQNLDVVSILSTEAQTWLRVGPEMDTGWIDFAQLGIRETTKLVLRSCRPGTEAPGVAGYGTRDAADRTVFMSRLRWVGEESFKDSEGYSGPRYQNVPRGTLLEYRPLGLESVSTWLLDNVEQIRTRTDGGEWIDPATVLRELPRSSEVRQKHIVWQTDPRFPISSTAFLPMMKPSVPADARFLALESETLSVPDAVCADTRDVSNTSCNRRIFSPRNSESDFGFEWGWHGLGSAATENPVGMTGRDGCLEDSGNTWVRVKLGNEYLRVQSRGEQIFEEMRREDPPIFIGFGDSSFSMLIGANVFMSGNEALEKLACRVHPWSLDRFDELAMKLENRGRACNAFHELGSIYLPMVCPGLDGFTAKGLCDDVVRHEMSHEFVARMVELGTAGRKLKIHHSRLFEALADFFAVVMRDTLTSRIDEFGKHCQNDHRSFYQLKFGSQDRLVLAFLEMAEDSDISLVARLAAISSLYGWQGRDSYFKEFLELAQMSGSVDLEPMCQVLQDRIQFCESPCTCAKLVGAGRLTSAPGGWEPADDQEVSTESSFRVEFLAPDDEACNASFEVHQGGKLVQTPDLQRLGAVSRQFEYLALPPNPRQEFTVSLRSQCPAAAFVDSLGIRGLPFDSQRFQQDVIEIQHGPTSESGPEWIFAQLHSGQIVASRPGGSTILWSGPALIPGFWDAHREILFGWTNQSEAVRAEFDSVDAKWRSPGGPGTPEDLDIALRYLLRPDRGVLRPALEPLLARGAAATRDAGRESQDPPKLDWVNLTTAEAGLSTEGLVVRTLDRLTRARQEASWAATGFEPSSSNWSGFPTDDPGVVVYQSDSGDDRRVAERVLIAESYCKAPPFLAFHEDQLIALTCDGIAVGIDPMAETLGRLWTLKVEGAERLEAIVAPERNIRPMHFGDIDGDGHEDMILGPFRLDKEGRYVDRIFAYDLHAAEAGQAPPMIGDRIETQRETSGSPVVGNFDGDACVEVAVAMGDQVDFWDFDVPCPDPDSQASNGVRDRSRAVPRGAAAGSGG